MTVHEPFAVKERKGVQNWLEHLAGFHRGERPLWKNLRQVLFGVLHHHVERLRAAQLAPSRLKQAKQVRMRQLGGQLPAGELDFRVSCIHRNEFDSDLFRFASTAFRKEHGAVVRATQVLAQMEFPVDELAFPLFPVLGHFAPLTLLTLSSLTGLGRPSLATLYETGACRKRENYTRGNGRI